MSEIAEFSEAGLRAQGFAGGVALLGLEAGLCPEAPGVYAVLRPGGGPVTFLAASRGGHFRGRDPSVPEDILQANWVEGAEVLYIGGTRLPLATRLKQLADFGAGFPARNWGGRLLWQLADSERLQVFWRATPALSLKALMLDRFQALYGTLPFANNPALAGGPSLPAPCSDN